MAKNIKIRNFQDVYYDGFIDIKNEIFCEDEQRIYKRKNCDGWDEVGTWNDGNGYIDCLGVLHEKEYGDYGYTYDLKMMRGEIKRLGEE